jgi:hypothetical protein
MVRLRICRISYRLAERCSHFLTMRDCNDRKLSFNLVAPTYSFVGGNNAVLSNGYVEFCESAEPAGVSGDVYEFNHDHTPQMVWHMNIKGLYAYRGQRIPSLYPGVQR